MQTSILIHWKSNRTQSNFQLIRITKNVLQDLFKLFTTKMRLHKGSISHNLSAVSVTEHLRSAMSSSNCSYPNDSNILTLSSYSTHKRVHTLPFKCTIPSCRSAGFRYSKDLDRHVDSVHKNDVPGTRRFYCPVKTCKYSKEYGKGQARLDNMKRHMRTAHPKVAETEIINAT